MRALSKKFDKWNETGMVSRVNTGEIRSKIERVRVDKTKISHTIMDIGDRCAIPLFFSSVEKGKNSGADAWMTCNGFGCEIVSNHLHSGTSVPRVQPEFQVESNPLHFQSGILRHCRRYSIRRGRKDYLWSQNYSDSGFRYLLLLRSGRVCETSVTPVS